MSTCTVGETKNNLSAILEALASGREKSHVIRNRRKPVAVILPIDEPQTARKPFGYGRDERKAVDWEAFDAMDAEIAEEFGL